MNLDLSHFSTWPIRPKIFKELKYVTDKALLLCTKKKKKNKIRKPFSKRYQEFIKLIILFLGKMPPRRTHFGSPDAYNSARWMTKEIYCFKILIYQQFKHLILKKKAFKEICWFIVKGFLETWINSSNLITAFLMISHLKKNC